MVARTSPGLKGQELQRLLALRAEPTKRLKNKGKNFGPVPGELIPRTLGGSTARHIRRLRVAGGKRAPNRDIEPPLFKRTKKRDYEIKNSITSSRIGRTTVHELGDDALQVDVGPCRLERRGKRRGQPLMRPKTCWARLAQERMVGVATQGLAASTTLLVARTWAPLAALDGDHVVVPGNEPTSRVGGEVHHHEPEQGA